MEGINSEFFLLGFSVILLISIFASKASFRIGIPTLLLFLVVGMLFGTSGLGIEFNNAGTVQFVGMIALTIILFSGGMDTNYREIQPVLKQGIVLATLGVLLTAFITGAFIYYISNFIFHKEVLSFTESLLLASVMSSTDSASVFSILRCKDIKLKENLKSTIELESGSNDPMAYMLTIILIGLIQIGEFSISSIFIQFFAQMIIGGLIGYVFGRLSVVLINRINIPNKSLYPILLIASAFLTFSASTLLKGNGYLSVYIAGLVIGNYKLIHKKSMITFFDGFTWLFQIIMFIMLGLLVNPKELLDVILIGLAISIFVVIFARPISVFLSLLPFKKTSFKGKLFISWVGLRGAVPIIFATYPLVQGLEHANLFFNIVFFITLVSLLVQGTTIAPIANWLKLIDHTKVDAPIDVTLPEEAKSAISEIIVTKDLLTRGNKLINLSLPENTLVIMIKRDSHYFVPTGGSIIKENDKLMIISDNEKALIETYKSLGINDFMLRS